MDSRGKIDTLANFEAKYLEELKHLDPKQKQIELAERIAKLENVPVEKVAELTAMNRKQRRAWYAAQRKLKGVR